MSPVNRECPREGHGQLLVTPGTVLSVSAQSVGIGGLKIKVVSLSDCSDNRYWVYFLANDSVTQVVLVRLLRSCTRYLVEKVDTGDHSALGLASGSASSSPSRGNSATGDNEVSENFKNQVNSYFKVFSPEKTLSEGTKTEQCSR